MLTVTTSLALAATRDPGSTRLVYSIVIALGLLGIGLAVFAWWLTRVTRPDRELLAPLEAIQSRRWRRLDPAGRRRLLDELRPEGAEPQDPAPSAPRRDDEFGDLPTIRDVRELAPTDDDLPAVSPPEPDSTTAGSAVVGEVGLANPAASAPQPPRTWDLWDADPGPGAAPVGEAVDGDAGGAERGDDR